MARNGFLNIGINISNANTSIASPPVINPVPPTPPPPPFDPLTIPTLKLWLDANDTNTLTLISDPAGFRVSNWTDKSNSNFFVTNSTTNSQPIYSPTALNGSKPGVSFDGIDDYLYKTSSTAISYTPHVFFVLDIKELTSTNNNFMSDTNFGYFFGTNQADINEFNTIKSNGTKLATEQIVFTQGSMVSIFYGRGLGTNQSEIKGPFGTTQFTLDSGAYGPTFSTMILGGFLASTYYSKVTISEVLIFDGKLTPAEQTNVENYLKNKWQVNLPKAFSPINIPSLRNWLDANDSSSITQSSNRVSIWSDKSNRKANQVQFTGSDQPEFSSVGLDGVKPAIRYDGSSWSTYQDPAYKLGDNFIHLFFVMRIDSSKPNSLFFAEIIDGYSIGQYTQPFGFIMCPDGNLGNNNLLPTNISYTGNTKFKLEVYFERNGSNNSYIIGPNNSTNFTLNTNSYIATSLSNLTLARNPQNGSYSNVRFSELLIFNKKLTATENSDVNSYLSNKWGV